MQNRHVLHVSCVQTASAFMLKQSCARDDFTMIPCAWLCWLWNTFHWSQGTCFHATWRKMPVTTKNVACDKTPRMTSTGHAIEGRRLHLDHAIGLSIKRNIRWLDQPPLSLEGITCSHAPKEAAQARLQGKNVFL